MSQSCLVVPKYDFHLHTDIIGCANETMDIDSIVEKCIQLGCTAIAITDHLNRKDQLGQHKEICEKLLSLDTPLDIYFGAELNYSQCDEDFFYNEEIRDEYGFQFAIGGIHEIFVDQYDIKKIIEIQHRHHIRTCMNPLVDVLVHPYWFSPYRFDLNGFPRFTTMKDVPESLARELGQVAKETSTAIEINSHSMLDPTYTSDGFVKEYIDYLSIIANTGATFSVGSDAHDFSHLDGIQETWDVIKALDIPADRVFCPSCKPINVD